MHPTLEYILNKTGANIQQPSPIYLDMDRVSGLPKFFRRLGFKIGAEIGVSNGRYSKNLCRFVPGLKLYCIDPYFAYPDYVEAGNETGQKMLNVCYENAKVRLAPYNCEFLKMDSLEAAKLIPDGSLDFVYIDGNHSFEYAVRDIATWSKKVRVGGIVSGHDYWNSSEVRGVMPFNRYLPPITKIDYGSKLRLCQVKDAVDAWTKTNKIHPWFVTALDLSSWFWVR